jgi:S-adenosylmethionine:tRNA ribosyltransferase-isomerase
MKTDDFDYELPSGLIAQSPVVPRDSCRLMVLDRASGQTDHRAFTDITDYLRADDVLVVNETRVLPARLKGQKRESGGAVEMLLLRERYEDTWECLVKPGRRLQPGAHVEFGDGRLSAMVVESLPESGTRLVSFKTDGESFLDSIHALGEVPLPPYITKELDDPELYQTVFSRDERSAAAPTAGLHFTPELMERIEGMGVAIAKVELDVGLDTFRPVAEDRAEDHSIHSEHFRIAERDADIINEARAKGGRIIAVGTTSVRALESAYSAEVGKVEAQERVTDLFILPGHAFHAVDAMVTNFHMPRTTLLMLVSAFAGRGTIMDAYEEAIGERYRMLSFGDAMLIL